MSFHDRRTVLFDLDGTLVDSSGDLTGALNHVLEEDGLRPLSRRQVVAMIGDGAETLLRLAYEHHGSTPPAGALERYRRRYADHCLERTRAYAGVPELLERLAPERVLAVVTNKPTPFAEQVVAGLGLAPYFGAVVGPELARRRKPAPEHLFAALEALGSRPAEAVMVGDAPTDVAAGRQAGTATVAVLWGYRGRRELAASGPDRIASSVGELAEILTPAQEPSPQPSPTPSHPPVGRGRHRPPSDHGR